MSKNLSYFMRDEAKFEEIVSVPGVESIRDENGEVIPFEIKVLSQKSIQEITKNYTTRTMVTDEKRQPLIRNGNLVYEIETDRDRVMRHIVVEALQYPNLKDAELMSFFNCHDVTQMPLLVFPKTEEYFYVINLVYTALGIRKDRSGGIEEAKN